MGDTLSNMWAGLGFGSSAPAAPAVPIATGFQIPSVGGQPPQQLGVMGTTPAATAPATGAWGQGLGMNIGTGQLAVGGLTSLGNLWTGIQASSLAKDQLNFAKSIGNANLNNQMKTLNTRIEDRARARGVAEGQSQSQVDDYIARNSLTR